jgi:hypothetical protein
VNRAEAKKLLAACRPSGADAHAPHLAAAFALVERDAELREWFEAEQATDAVIAAKLKAAPLPENLLEQIRAGAQERLAAFSLSFPTGGEGRGEAAQLFSNQIPLPRLGAARESDAVSSGARRRWQPSLTLAMAACLALLGLLTVLWLNRTPAAAPGSFAAYRTDMAQLLREFPRLDIATDRLPEVRQWLTQQHPLLKADLPKVLEQFPSIGCRTVEWQGKKLALVCFMVEGQVVHLFVMPRNTFPDAGSSARPMLARVGPQNTASWSGPDNQYLLVTQAGESMLRKLLSPPS